MVEMGIEWSMNFSREIKPDIFFPVNEQRKR